MKKAILSSLLFICSITFGQNDFEYSYPGLYDSKGRCGLATSDSSFVAIGNIEEFIRIDTLISECIDCLYQFDTIIYDLLTDDILIIKTDNKGDTLWTKRLGNEENEWSHYIIQTSDDGLLIAANDYQYAALIIKVDSSGDTLWTSKLANHYPRMLFEMDSSYYAVGSKSHVIDGQTEIYLQCLNLIGEEKWLKYFGKDQEFTSACLIDGNQLLISGENNWDINLFKVDYAGEITWEKQFVEEGHQNVVSIKQTNDGNFLVLYNYAAPPIEYMQPRLLKMNSEGDKIWEKGYFDSEFHDIAVHLQIASDGGFLVTGILNNNWWESPAYILKTNDLGIPEWIKYLSYGSDYIRPAYMVETYDDGYFVVGTNKDQQLTLIKTGRDNLNYDIIYQEITGIQKIKDSQPYKIYPNPTYGLLMVELNSNSAELFVQDINGRILISMILSNGINNIQFNSLPNGVYGVRIKLEDMVYQEKIINLNRF